MKVIVQRTPGSAALPFNLEYLKLHLRAPDDAEDIAIQSIGQTAAAEIEQFAQIGLLTQTITVTIFSPSGECGLSLPIGLVAD